MIYSFRRCPKCFKFRGCSSYKASRLKESLCRSCLCLRRLEIAQAALLPIGTERIMKIRNLHVARPLDHQLYVVVGHKKSDHKHYNNRMTKAVWKRKAVIVLESALGRCLNSTELRSIHYLDGDILNCELSNLQIRSERTRLRECERCGDLKVLTSKTQSSALKSSLCATCYLFGPKISGDRTLSAADVSLLKSLKSPGHFKGSYAVCKLVNWFGTTPSVVSHILRGNTYKEVKAMARPEQWKALLVRHDKLVKEANCILYDRVTLLKTVYEDPLFKEAQEAAGVNPTKLINEKLTDTCTNFVELLQILRLFPNRRQWQTIGLSEMRQKMLESLQKAYPPKPRKPKETATVAEVKDLHVRIDSYADEASSLRKQLKEKERTITKLEAALDQANSTIETLKETNQNLNEAIRAFKSKSSLKA